MINVPQEIKDILHQDTCQKNIRIHFPNGERTDICNDLIVMDSVSFKESLCSQNSFKFGLAESPIFECEVVGVSNIKGVSIEVYCEIFCPNTVQGAVWRIDIQQWVYPISYGEFTVYSCERQTDILHRKIIAYGFVQNLNESLSEFELAKLRVAENTTYTPSGFLFSTANFNLKKYDPDVFIPESVSPTGTEEGISETLYWTNITTGQTLHAEFNIKYDVYTLSDSAADYLFYLLVQQAESVDTFTSYIYDFLYQFDGYRLNKKLIRDCIVSNRLTYTVTWSTGSVYYGGYEDEMICYPYFTGATVTFKIPRYFEATVPLQIQTQIRTIEHEYLTATMQRLTQEYYAILNRFRLSIPIGYWGPEFGDGFSNQQVFRDCLELIGCFGNYRDGFLKIVNIRLQYELLSDESLYPDTDLYPGADVGASILPQDYQSCWYNDDYSKPYGKIMVYYTNTTNNASVEEYYIGDYDEESDIDSYQTYIITTDNLLLKNSKYLEAYIVQLCYEISENIRGVTFMPVKLVGRGLPYVQPGDTFEVLTATNDSVTTIVLSRTLKGEMVLTDEYVSVL